MNKIHKHRWTNKSETTKITKIMNETRNTTNLTEIKGIQNNIMNKYMRIHWITYEMYIYRRMQTTKYDARRNTNLNTATTIHRIKKKLTTKKVDTHLG